MNLHVSRSTLAVLGVFFLGAVFGSQATDIIAAKPTHYFYTPMARVNPAGHLVLSLHEISYGLPAHLQVQASLFDNIGRINFGAKFGLSEDLAIGAGLAASLTSFGGHAIKPGYPGRFGAFLTYDLAKSHTFAASITGHTQLFDHNSIGCDFGLMSTPASVWSLIGEVGTSIDLTEDPARFYFNIDGGLRIHPTSVPFLNFDLGIDVEEFALNVRPARTDVRLYLDVIFAMVTR
jgi:hypothetical protein